MNMFAFNLFEFRQVVAVAYNTLVWFNREQVRSAGKTITAHTQSILVKNLVGVVVDFVGVHFRFQVSSFNNTIYDLCLL